MYNMFYVKWGLHLLIIYIKLVCCSLRIFLFINFDPTVCVFKREIENLAVFISRQR